MKKILLAVTALFISIGVNAQGNDIMKDFQEFRQGIMNDYNQFREQVLTGYLEFVKSSWAEYDSQRAIDQPRREKFDPPVPYVEPQPVQPQPVTPQPDPIVIPTPIFPPVVEPQPEPVVIPDPILPPVVEPQPQPILEDIKKGTPQPVVDKESFSFNYLNTVMTVNVKRGQKIHLQGTDGTSIADFLKQYSDKSNDAMVADCLALRSKNCLCDWAYLNMLLAFSKAYYGSDCNDAMMLAAYVYIMSGYSMRFAVSGNSVFLLYASKHLIYNKQYFVIDGVKYYPLSSCPSSITICDAVFPKEKALSLYIDREPLLSVSQTSPRKLQASQYEDMNFTLTSNKNLIDFFGTYPSSEIDNDMMTRWAMYANTPISEQVRDVLYPGIRNQIDGLGKREAVGRILNWVQTAFVYKLDNEVWGDDRAFFADETIFYPYSDCEDRSILFSRIVRDLLGLDVVLLYYPGHLATAVLFSEDETYGDLMVIGGKKYTVCDPTYTSAPVGLAMSKYKNSSAKAIKLK